MVYMYFVGIPVVRDLLSPQSFGPVALKSRVNRHMMTTLYWYTFGQRFVYTESNLHLNTA